MVNVILAAFIFALIALQTLIAGAKPLYALPAYGFIALAGILSIIPLLLLSGGVSPRESMPPLVQHIMLGAPTTYFVRLAQAILYRGAGFDVIWRDLLAMTGVGACFFTIALLRFRKAVTQTQV